MWAKQNFVRSTHAHVVIAWFYILSRNQAALMSVYVLELPHFFTCDLFYRPRT